MKRIRLKLFLDFSKQDPIKIPYFNSKTKVKSIMVVKADTNNINIKKLKQSVVPNFIHHLDSEILRKVVFEFKKKGKPI